MWMLLKIMVNILFHDDIVIASDDSDGDDYQYVPHMAIAEVLEIGNL